ncbi:trace amine-associated receptor 1-like [Sebastes umbrosus]|uniref:trace amine-associated receptor 1-like n=1 Tax=Sebastes umbrosus TaxID=72105 RepID=UPI00189E3BB8|nr:trace amine-associated receptor 1-like [Sebastes umbrosus]
MTSTEVQQQNTTQFQIRRAVPPNHRHPGFSIVAHVSIEVPQENYIVPGWRPFQDASQRLPLVHRGQLQHNATQLWLVSNPTPARRLPPWATPEKARVQPLSRSVVSEPELYVVGICCKYYLSINDHLCMELKSFINRSDDFGNESANVSGMTAVTTSYLLCIFVGCLSVLIICGNLLVIISIIYFQQLHTPTNYLILSLAVADLLVGVLVLPFSVTLAVCSCCYFDLLCKVRGILDMFLCTCSILNLCCISVDRYYAVCQPLRYRSKINVHVIVIMILVSWTVSAIFGIGNMIQGMNQGQSNRCGLFQHTIKRTAFMGTIFTFYLSAIVMFSIYLKIFMVAQRQARSIQNTTCQNKKSGATVSKMEKKATKTLAIVMGIFLICWTPFFLCISSYLLNNDTIPIPVINLLKWFGWSNSMLNPFVCGFFYTWFRKAFRMIISGKIFQGDFTKYKLL